MIEQGKGADNGATYMSYLLRLWRVIEGGEAAWRASLEDPHTGERLGFAGLWELLNYLEARTRGRLDSQSRTGRNHHEALPTNK